ncbi:RNA polymerase sigma-70 factor [Chitinophaga defluvii]|uniref:RNA polymerase sigma-70 factor n=1 Tax=Chitinophaga defluvii TaxID=3163343 RepID=A0ABV2TE32_9BACT
MDKRINTASFSADNQAAFAHFFHTYYEQLHRYAFTIVKNNEEAEDIVQAVFAKLWEKWNDIDMQESARAYLYKWVHNRCLNNLRHERIRANYVVQATAANTESRTTAVENSVQEKELGKQIRDAIASLPAQCRLIFQKSRFEHKKYHEIADELSISPKTVEVQMGKALKVLRKKLLDITGKS